MAERAGFRPPRYIILIAVLLIASIVGAVGVMTSGSETLEPCELPDEPATAPGLLQEFVVAEDRKAPDFALRNAREPGEVVQLSSFCGQPVVLLWAVEDCPACADSLTALAGVPGDAVVVVIGPAEEATTLPAFVDARLPGAEALVDEDDLVSVAYGLRQVPLAMVLDKDHIVREILDVPGDVSNDLPGALAEVTE